MKADPALTERARAVLAGIGPKQASTIAYLARRGGWQRPAMPAMLDAAYRLVDRGVCERSATSFRLTELGHEVARLLGKERTDDRTLTERAQAVLATLDVSDRLSISRVASHRKRDRLAFARYCSPVGAIALFSAGLIDAEAKPTDLGRKVARLIAFEEASR